MSIPVEPGSHRRTPVLSVAPWIVLLPLAQAGLGYLSTRSSSPWPWLVGTPLCYLLIGALAAFSANGGLIPAQARKRGVRIGLITGIGGAVLAALLVALLLVWSLHTAQMQSPSASRLPGPGLALFALFFWFVPLFLLLNLLGIALAPLGGLLGDSLRSLMKREGQEWPGEEKRARS